MIFFSLTSLLVLNHSSSCNLQGLWRGTGPALLLTVPYCAVQFLVLQRCKQQLKSRGLENTRTAAIGSFASGAAAGAAATVASYPFDLLRTVLAAQGEPKTYSGLASAATSIVKAKGIRGLYSGVGITVVEIIPYAAIQFGTYDLLTSRVAEWNKKDGKAAVQNDVRIFQQFCCGLIAGVAGKVCAFSASLNPFIHVTTSYQRSYNDWGKLGS